MFLRRPLLRSWKRFGEAGVEFEQKRCLKPRMLGREVLVKLRLPEIHELADIVVFEIHAAQGIREDPPPLGGGVCRSGQDLCSWFWRRIGLDRPFAGTSS